MLNERNHASHDTLNVSAMTERNIRSTKKLIAEGWGIENREDLFDMLLKMHLQGHRARFDVLGNLLSSFSDEELRLFIEQIKDNTQALNEVRVVKEYYNKLGDKSIIGWDYSRYICLCRWGYHVGYLSEDEAWEMIMEAARLLQERFDSWEDLGNNYMIGRLFWSPKQVEEDEDIYEDAFMRLMDMKSSPWNLYAWDTDLGVGKTDKGVTSTDNFLKSEIKLALNGGPK